MLPGGAYQYQADHEGEPVARRMNAEGFFAAVLKYRVAPYRAPIPQWDAQKAVQVLRRLASRYGYPAEHIAILGFSAGGHLAASITYLDIPPYHPDDETAQFDPCPNAAILCYPVVTMGAKTHMGSRDNLLGAKAGADAIRTWSIEGHIRTGASPAFLWHTAEDASVPVDNSLMLASSLADKAVPFSMHIWPHGRHGMGLADEQPDIAKWPALAAEWLHSLGY